MNKVTFPGFRAAISPIAPGSVPIIRLVTREFTRIDNKDIEPKAPVRLLKLVPRRKFNFFKDTYCQNYCVIFPMTEWERMLFAKRHLQTIKWKNTKRNCNTTGGAPSQIWPFPRVNTMLCIPRKSIHRYVVRDCYQFANGLSQTCLL